jgi:hypothetical protein
MALLRRYWGYVLAALLVFLLIRGAADPTVVFPLGAAAAVYFFFQVPVWCGATTREGKACRNNSRGLLFGCNQFREHKMQVFKAAIVPRTARELYGAYWASPRQRLATVTAFGTLLAALVALAAVILNRG